jgi:N,N'-diacetyllegionaminate synthase
MQAKEVEIDTARKRCLIIGEVAQAHDGSLGMAHAFIDAIAGAGADAVKFQAHIAAAESTLEESWRVKFSPQDAARYLKLAATGQTP